MRRCRRFSLGEPTVPGLSRATAGNRRRYARAHGRVTIGDAVTSERGSGNTRTRSPLHAVKRLRIVVENFLHPVGEPRRNPRLRDALEAECLFVELCCLLLVGYRDRDMPKLAFRHVLPPVTDHSA